MTHVCDACGHISSTRGLLGRHWAYECRARHHRIHYRIGVVGVAEPGFDEPGPACRRCLRTLHRLNPEQDPYCGACTYITSP